MSLLGTANSCTLAIAGTRLATAAAGRPLDVKSGVPSTDAIDRGTRKRPARKSDGETETGRVEQERSARARALGVDERASPAAAETQRARSAASIATPISALPSASGAGVHTAPMPQRKAALGASPRPSGGGTGMLRRGRRNRPIGASFTVSTGSVEQIRRRGLCPRPRPRAEAATMPASRRNDGEEAQRLELASHPGQVPGGVAGDALRRPGSHPKISRSPRSASRACGGRVTPATCTSSTSPPR